MQVVTVRHIPNYLNFLNRPSGPTMVSVDFEVYGDVQGVFFTKYCKEMCQNLQLRGWVRNSRYGGTVVGVIQGEKDRVDDMALWLRLQGSPGSRIHHCDFRNWQIVDGYDYRDFRMLEFANKASSETKQN